LVGRSRSKLDELQKIIEHRGQEALSVVCDLSDPASVRRAAAEIVALPLSIGLLGASSNLKAFTLLVLLACTTPVVCIVYIYIRNEIQYPQSHTSFIHEPISWLQLTLNLSQILLAVTRLRHTKLLPPP